MNEPFVNQDGILGKISYENHVN